jgi:plastocyanin
MGQIRRLGIYPREFNQGASMKKTAIKISLVACCLVFAGAIQPDGPKQIAQIVALDECDPTTFNAAIGPDFCKNVSLAVLGYATTIQDLFSKAAAGTPDPKWDFEPDTLTINKGTVVSVVDQGGEPHTFTEVKQFGGGFIAGLNSGEAPVPECAAGFNDVAVAKTRIIQGSTSLFTGLSKGTHYFQCCLHPWMRVKVEVK